MINGRPLTAIHEAGHALVNLINGRRFDRIEVRADGSGGIVDPAKPRSRRAEIQCRLGGIVAERLANLESAWGDAIEGSRVDIAAVRRLEPTREEVEQSIREDAGMLSSNWPRLQAIASAALESPLSEREVSAIFQRVNAGPENAHAFKPEHFTEVVDAVCGRRTESAERRDLSDLRPACYVAPGERAVDVCQAADAKEKLALARSDVSPEIQIQAMAAGYAAEAAHPDGPLSVGANEARLRATFAILDREVARMASERGESCGCSDANACECTEHTDDPAERPTAWVQNDSARNDMTTKNDSEDQAQERLDARTRAAWEQPSPFQQRRAARRDAQNPNLTGDPDPNDTAHRSLGGNDARNAAKPSQRAINNAGPWLTPDDCTCPHFPGADEEHAKECPLFEDPSGGPRVVAPTKSARAKASRGDADRIDGDPEREEQDRLREVSAAASDRMGRPTTDYEEIEVDSDDEATAQAQSLARSAAMFARPFTRAK